MSLTVVGATEAEVAPLLVESRGVTALGKVPESVKAECIASADLLVAPSLGGESFGMVLTEAFAAGTPVIASDIPGYRDVVHDGVEGLLVGRGRRGGPRAIAARPRVRSAPQNGDGRRCLRGGAALRVGADLGRGAHGLRGRDHRAGSDRRRDACGDSPRRDPVRRPAAPAGSPKPAQPRALPIPTRTARALTGARRAGLALLAIGGLILAGLALRRIGVEQILNTLLTSSPGWVVVALGLMGFSMVLRAVAWHAILRAALPRSTVRLRDALQGTFIGVLMSATLPARLGEPSRSLIVARRIGRPRETLPAVLGTMVAQTLINLLALCILGVCVFSSINIFDGHHGALVVAAIAPAAVLARRPGHAVVLRGGAPSRSALGPEPRRPRSPSARPASAAACVSSAGPRLAAIALAGQLSAWALQWLSCYALLAALGLNARAPGSERRRPSSSSST